MYMILCGSSQHLMKVRNMSQMTKCTSPQAAWATIPFHSLPLAPASMWPHLPSSTLLKYS